jgi:hypothetical protein
MQKQLVDLVDRVPAHDGDDDEDAAASGSRS